ncbi:hypothetical protein YQE_08196, partial [Dendroctonus ponderosae]
AETLELSAATNAPAFSDKITRNLADWLVVEQVVEAVKFRSQIQR